VLGRDGTECLAGPQDVEVGRSTAPGSDAPIEKFRIEPGRDKLHRLSCGAVAEPPDEGRTEAGPARVAAAEWPLIGRARELAVGVNSLTRSGSAGLALVGAAGIGKSHLAASIVAGLSERGVQVLRGFGRESSQSIPLSVFAYLVPAADTTAGGLVDPAVRALAGHSRDDVVFIDDAHAMDDTSAEVVVRLARTQTARLLLTIRAEARVAPAIAQLWQSGTLTRVDLAPLPREAMATIVSSVLGGPMDGISLHTLLHMAAGNPMFLRETMLGALDSRVLAEHNGRWQLTRPLASIPRLNDLVASRLAAVPSRLLEVMEIMAVSGPIEVGLATRVCAASDLEALETLGLARVSGSNPDSVIDLAHPIYAEVLRERLPALTVMRFSRLLADTHDDLWPHEGGPTPPALVVRGARWRLDAGGAIDVVRMREATTIAHAGGDHALTERLGRAALQVDRDAETALLVSWSLGQLGRHDESLDVLRGVTRNDPAAAAAVTIRHADVLFWVYDGADRARQLCESAASELTGEWRDELRAQLGTFEMLAGRPASALAMLEPMFESPHGHVVVRAAMGATQALAVAGRGTEAIALADRAFALHTQLIPTPFGDPGMHVLGRGMACALSGRLDDADGIARLGYEAAVALAHGPGVGWFAMLKAWLALRRGRLLDAAADATEAGAAWQENGIGGPCRWSFAGALLAHAQRGDLAATEAARTALEAVPSDAIGHMMSLVEQALAWSDVLRRQLALARDRLAQCAVAAAASGSLVPAAEAWHDLLRLGDPAGAAAGFATIPVSDDPLPAVWRAHVDASVAGDATGVVRAASRFEELGCLLWAAEASASAAALSERDGNGAAARRMRVKAATLAAECQGAATPMLSDAAAVVTLTRRERDVAELAAQGHSNRAISSALGLSERTVENHLYRVFTKLDVRTRAELPDALGWTTGSRW
jgi:DNA-binding CsgD family transcriptional regulator